MTDPRHRFGLSCVLAAGLFTSLAGILVRSIESADGWQILFYRCLACCLILLVFIGITHRRATLSAFVAIGRPGLLAAVSLAVAFCCFILALLETTVANVVFILSASPFFAAVFGWLVLREPVRRALWIAMLAAAAGIGLMMGDGLVAGTLTGNLLAMVSCICYALAVVMFRQRRHVDMLPAPCLAGFLAALVSAFFVERFWIGLHDFALATVLGIVTLGFQYILVTIGARHVRAAEVAFLTRIQVVLAPLWVWLGVGELPSALTLLGGGILLSSLIGHAVYTLRSPA